MRSICNERRLSFPTRAGKGGAAYPEDGRRSVHEEVDGSGYHRGADDARGDDRDELDAEQRRHCEYDRPAADGHHDLAKLKTGRR